MRMRRLGRSGLAVSVVGLGCNNFGSRIGREATAAVVRAAVECGDRKSTRLNSSHRH